jgi:membrane-bound lytic murein transglycosylase F
VLGGAGRRSDREASISPYDALARRYGAAHNLDWRLVVALMYQESRFQEGLVSPAGATGLMQILPETAAELGVVDLHDPDESVRAGTLYLSRLVQRWDPRLPLSTRLRFALASYDAGLGHVLDARQLAREIGLNPDRWYGNVERAMLLLEQEQYFANAKCGYCRGSETVHYVEEIDRRYRLYIQHAPEEPQPGSPAGQMSFLPPA